MQDFDQHPHIIPFPANHGAARPPSPMRIGLLAGAGQFPVRFAEAAQNNGFSVFCLGVTRKASPDLTDVCDTFRYAPLSRIGKVIRLLQGEGIEHLVMAGRIERSVLFDSFRWLRLLPDMRTIQMWVRFARQRHKDDTLLLTLVREFERDGFQFDSAFEYAPELLVKHGFLTARKPTASHWRDIYVGWNLARELGRLKVGQTVIVNDSAVIAVEAIEGMDACIRRAGELCPRGGFTIVKVARTQQDMRFDVPTIGVETIKTMHQAGGRILAIESGMSTMIDPDDVIAVADRLGISIVAVNAEELAIHAAA